MNKRQLEARAESSGDDETVNQNLTSSSNSSNEYQLPQHQRQAAFSLLWLFVFSCLMFTMPFGAFFGVRHIVHERFPSAGQFAETGYSVLAAVLTVNMIIGMYALLAYHETEYDADGREVDQSKYLAAGGGLAERADNVVIKASHKRKKRAVKEQ